MEPTTSNSQILLWLAGFFLAAWNTLLTLILGQQFIENRGLRKEIKGISKEREDHCIPRNECKRTHEGLNERFSIFETDVKEGIKGIHARLDTIVLITKKGCEE